MEPSWRGCAQEGCRDPIPFVLQLLGRHRLPGLRVPIACIAEITFAPMTAVTPMQLKEREDNVTDGDIADDIVRNAPATENHFFVVPKVVE